MKQQNETNPLTRTEIIKFLVIIQTEREVSPMTEYMYQLSMKHRVEEYHREAEKARRVQEAKATSGANLSQPRRWPVLSRLQPAPRA